MAKARNWVKESFIMRYDRLAFADVATPETALGMWQILREFFKNWEVKWKYPESVLVTFSQRKSAWKLDNEEYRIKILSKKLWAYKTNYKSKRKSKFRTDMLEEWYSEEEVEKIIKNSSIWQG